MSGKKILWLTWWVGAIVGAVLLVGSMFVGGPLRGKFLPGPSTNGHHQLELACDSCHTSPFGGGPVLQTACVGCHEEGLNRSRDTHPAKKFDDPRNADRLAILPVDKCVTCHSEHRPELTGTSGVTIPKDFCFLCHQDVAKERPTHVGLSFDTCSSAGCHRYHDNRSTYEKFIARSLDAEETKLSGFIKLRGLDNPLPKKAVPLTLASIDAPSGKGDDAAINQDWLASTHARAGVNCSGCHQPKTADAAPAPWSDKPGQKVCATCHEAEVAGFVDGRHGMRLADGIKEISNGLFGLIQEKPLGPMRPELARLPMEPKAHGRDLTCSTCHGAHDAKTVKSQTEACLTCHADDHSKAFTASPHGKLWQAELDGKLKKGQGVSCATCHMPREKISAPGGSRIVAAHNQNMNLRPSEKMARGVCMDCHSLEFTLNSLADTELVKRNFSGRPTHHNQGFDWVRQKNQKQ